MSKKILSIHTGGTISMSSSDDKVSVIGDNPVTIKNNVNLNYHVDEIYPIRKPSPHITLKDMKVLRDTILNHKAEYDGFVVTHGTDTLEETAYFLDLTLNISQPVIITGAMRSFNEIGSDGLYNYISSIRVASSDKAHNLGTLIVFNDEIHTARNVTKTHTSNIATFQSPNHGPIGFVTKDNIMFHHLISRQTYLEPRDLIDKVAVIKAYADMDNLLFEAIYNSDYKGVVIEALGQGNLPPTSVEGVKKLLEKGVVVVLVSRSFNGIVGSFYDYEGGGYNLKKYGVIFSNGLNGQKARIKLILALDNALDRKHCTKLFSM